MLGLYCAVCRSTAPGSLDGTRGQTVAVSAVLHLPTKTYGEVLLVNLVARDIDFDRLGRDSLRVYWLAGPPLHRHDYLKLSTEAYALKGSQDGKTKYPRSKAG